MPIYEYKGLNAAGKNVKGIQDAENQASLRDGLKSRGIFVTEVHEGKGGGATGVNKEVEDKLLHEIEAVLGVGPERAKELQDAAHG